MKQFTIFLLLTAFSIINLQAQDHAFELGYIYLYSKKAPFKDRILDIPDI